MNDLKKVFEKKGYILKDKIGKGSYGDIYLVEDKKSKQLYNLYEID